MINYEIRYRDADSGAEDANLIFTLEEIPSELVYTIKYLSASTNFVIQVSHNVFHHIIVILDNTAKLSKP